MKKKRHGNDRIELLSDLFCENAAEAVKKENAVYKAEAPLRVEIGCGKGDFVRQLSLKEADYNYLAIEKISDVAIVAAEKYAISRGLGEKAPNGGWVKADGTVTPYGEGKVDFTLEERGNVRFLVGDAKQLLESMPDDSVESLYINFCDPWGKKGYAKRRLTHIDFLNLYARILIPGGKLCFKTDNRELFDFSVEQIGESKFRIEDITYDLHASEFNAENLRTEYEENFSAKGFKINYLKAVNEK
ncbi:MAG: tRNA (guanosine(46)-N7)-methyltransferase TrmB [Clostridia bacterium]|nr:tRNA (guanosine(46)-N7)-methyltransferase TrmB [Clostridia bacterium]